MGRTKYVQVLVVLPPKYLSCHGGIDWMIEPVEITIVTGSILFFVVKEGQFFSSNIYPTPFLLIIKVILEQSYKSNKWTKDLSNIYILYGLLLARSEKENIYYRNVFSLSFCYL